MQFPKAIQKWQSEFNVNITVKKNGIFPLVLKSFVFIRDCDNFFKIPRLIGVKIVPFYETNDKINISIPCTTRSNKIVNFFKVKGLWNNETKFDWFIKPGEIISDGEICVVTYGALKSCSRRAFLTLANPITCNETLKINWHSIDNITNKDGDFTVSLNMSNQLNYPIRVNVLVDVADRPLFNTFLPPFMKMSSTIYNMGYCDLSLNKKGKKGDFINTTINCSFPDNWYCHDEFDVTVECAPFIFIENSSALGREFFDERFKESILPKYDVNVTVLDSIRMVWYNTPIFLYNAETLFPVVRGNVEFNGTSYVEETIDLVDERVNNATKGLQEFLFIFIIFIIIFLILYALFKSFLDWIVRKHS